MLHMPQWVNIVDNVTNTIQKPVVWTRVFIYQFGRHHGGCAVYTTSESLYGSEIYRNAQRCSWPAWSLFTKILASSFITILLEIVPDRNRGWWCSPNLLLNSCWTWTALCVSANLRTIKALWRGVNCTPTMMSSKLINEDPCSNHGLLDGVGNTINNVYSLKHMKHDKDEFIRYNCSQQIDNVNNTHLLGCCLSWSRIVKTELGKSVA